MTEHRVRSLDRPGWPCRADHRAQSGKGCTTLPRLVRSAGKLPGIVSSAGPGECEFVTDRYVELGPVFRIRVLSRRLPVLKGPERPIASCSAAVRTTLGRSSTGASSMPGPARRARSLGPTKPRLNLPLSSSLLRVSSGDGCRRAFATPRRTTSETTISLPVENRQAPWHTAWDGKRHSHATR